MDIVTGVELEMARLDLELHLCLRASSIAESREKSRWKTHQKNHGASWHKLPLPSRASTLHNTDPQLILGQRRSVTSKAVPCRYGPGVQFWDGWEDWGLYQGRRWGRDSRGMWSTAFGTHHHSISTGTSNGIWYSCKGVRGDHTSNSKGAAYPLSYFHPLWARMGQGTPEWPFWEDLNGTCGSQARFPSTSEWTSGWGAYQLEKKVTLEEQLTIFLYTCVTGLSVRHVGERFQWSNGTISKYVFHSVLSYNPDNKYQVFQRNAKHILFAPHIFEVCETTMRRWSYPSHYSQQSKILPLLWRRNWCYQWNPYCVHSICRWKRCVPEPQRIYISNCLVCCDFEMNFTYVLSGWEGSMANVTLYHDAQMSDFAIPAGMYYLADAGFPSCLQLLLLYCGQW